MAKQALGRGLEALLPDAAVTDDREVAEIELSRIKPGKSQPRTEFNAEKLQELAESIREKGFVQPVVVRQVDGGYELIAGERRLRAARALGLSRIPAIVKIADDGQALELAIVENIQRENFNPMEEARAYVRLSDEFGLRQEDVARRVGKSRASVANSVRLLKLPGEIQQAVADERISAGHAKVLLGVEEARLQRQLFERIVKLGLSVRESERAKERLEAGSKAKRAAAAGSGASELGDVEAHLRGALGTKVRIRRGRKKGMIEIEYYSAEDLERLIGIIAPGYGE